MENVGGEAVDGAARRKTQETSRCDTMAYTFRLCASSGLPTLATVAAVDGVWRHGSLVLGTCRHLRGQHHELFPSQHAFSAGSFACQMVRDSCWNTCRSFQ
jgi:hypothetical protein